MSDSPKGSLSVAQHQALHYLRSHGRSRLDHVFRVSTIRALLRRGLIASRNNSPSFVGNRYHLTKKADAYER